MTRAFRRGPRWARLLLNTFRTARGIVGLCLSLLVMLVAVAGPFLAPFSPTAFSGIPFAPPSGRHLLGTDDLGRDVLSRVMSGGWVLLIMAVLATALAMVVGVAGGVMSGYLGGKTDALIMRSADVVLAFPQLVFALLVLSLLGPKPWLVVLTVGFTHFPGVARVIRGASLEVSESDYVRAAEAIGMPRRKVMLKELLPNLVSPLMVEIGLRFTYSVLFVAALAFLGFGQQPPAPNWGVMISENRIGEQSNPYGVIVPALLLVILSIGVNTLTDAFARVSLGLDGREPDQLLLSESDVGV